MRFTAGLMALALASAPVHDDWLGSDKPLHFSATAGIALAGYAGARLLFRVEPPLAAGLGALAALTAGVAKDDKIALTGFLTFQRVSKAATTARNPRTGETVKVPAKKAPKVTVGATFKKVVNKEAPAPKLAKV